MGATINNFDKYFNESSEIQAFTIDKLSNAITRVIDRLVVDEEIFKLLYFEDEISLSHDLTKNIQAKDVFDKKLIGKHNSEYQRVRPYPFNPSAQTEHQAFIRVYFNQGSIDSSGVTSTNQINIDIIVSHKLWLTADPTKRLRLIRAYAILARVLKILRSEDKDKLPVPTGFTHLTVNEQFECIRIYANMNALENEELSQ